MNLKKTIAVSGVLCILSYMLAVFAPHPVLSLAGCALCGLSVGIMWPGTFSIAAKCYPAGGTGMFAILALAGDLGCSAGPTLAGFVADGTGDLKKGLLAAVVFPVIMVIGILMLNTKKAE